MTVSRQLDRHAVELRRAGRDPEATAKARFRPSVQPVLHAGIAAQKWQNGVARRRCPPQIVLVVEPQAPDLGWKAQEGGTLAGPDVPEFAAYTDRWGIDHKDGYFASFLTEIRRATLNQPASWVWPSGLDEGDTVALHVVPVGGEAEVIMGKGRSPVWVEDKLDYLLVRHQVADGSASHFVTVIDGYQGAPTVQAVRLVKADPITLEIERADGIDEVTVHIPDGPSRTTAHRALGVRVAMRNGEQTVRDVQVGDLGSGQGPGYANGRIVALDYDASEIAVEGDDLSIEGFAPGRAIRISNNMRTAMFTIAGAASDGDALRVTLDKPALMAQFPVESVDGNRLQLAVKSPFVTGHVNEETGELTDGANDYYYGSWIGEGGAARQVLGISNTDPAWLHVAGDTDETALERDYEGKVVSLWHYSVGDEVEVARVRH